MINGNASEFIDELTYQDHYVNYQGQKYFFNGCQCKTNSNGDISSVTLEVYNLTTDTTAFTTTQQSIARCIEVFESSKFFNGKSFWEAEKEMEWVDC